MDSLAISVGARFFDCHKTIFRRWGSYTVADTRNLNRELYFDMDKKRIQDLGSMDVSVHSGSGSKTSRSDDCLNKMGSVPQKDVANGEQNLINNARVLVFVVLVIAVIAVSTGTYLFVTDQERSEFENEVR